MPAATTSSDVDVPRSTGRVLDLLETVLDRGRCNLTTAAVDVDLTPTTALRHLRALEARGYLDRDPSGQFSAGPVILRLAAALRDTGPVDRLVAVAQPLLDRLTLQTGESSYLAVSDGRAVTYVATAESDRSIRHVGWIGQVVPLDRTAVGAALASPSTIVARTGAVEADIAAVSMALGVYAKLGVAVSVIGPAHRLDDDALDEVGSRVGEAVTELARVLGVEETRETR